MKLTTLKKKLDELYSAREAVLMSISNYEILFKPQIAEYSKAQQEDANKYEKGMHKTLRSLDKQIAEALKLFNTSAKV